MPDEIDQTACLQGFATGSGRLSRDSETALRRRFGQLRRLRGREWPESRIETALFPEPFRGSESAINPRARTVGATAPRGPCRPRASALHSPCIHLATGLQSCGKADPCHRGQMPWQVPNPIGSPFSRYPVRLPSASRTAGGARRGFRGAEFDAVEDGRQGGARRFVEDTAEGGSNKPQEIGRVMRGIVEIEHALVGGVVHGRGPGKGLAHARHVRMCAFHGTGHIVPDHELCGNMCDGVI